MKWNHAIRGSWRVAILALLALLVSGCLVADVTVDSAYDPKTDQFRILFLYQRIQCDDSATERDFLKALYQNRGSVLVPPMNVLLPAVLRLSNSQLGRVDDTVSVVPNGPPRSIASESTSLPLDDIKILPGKFFSQSGDDLCYYHQIVVPGKIVDQLLVEQMAWFANTGDDTIIAAIDKELKRRDAGGAVASWDQTYESVLASLNSSGTWDTGDDLSMLPVETKSLRMIRDQMASGKFGFHRHGAKISVVVPMTATDAAEMVYRADDLTKVLTTNWTAAGPPANAQTLDSKTKLAMLQSKAVVLVDSTHVELDIDLMKMMSAMKMLLDADAVDAPNGFGTGTKPSNNVHVTAAAISKEVAVDRHLTVNQIESDFKADKLFAFLPNPPVAPGTGLGQIVPATQP